MKKFLLVMMSVMIVFSLCSCGLFRKIFGKDEAYLETLEYYSDSRDPKYRRVIISRPSKNSKATMIVYYADGEVRKKELSSVALNTIEVFIGKIEDAEGKEGKDKEHLLLKWSDGRVQYVNLLNKREDEMSFFDSVRDALDKLVESLNMK